MRTLGILALAGLGIGIFLRTERGKQVLSQATTAINDGKERMMDAMNATDRGGSEQMVRKALARDYPETTMAQAFEEAIAA